MLENTNDLGTCFGCQQAIANSEMLSHFETCRGRSIAARHKQHTESEKVFMMRVDMDNHFWLFAEVKGSTTLQNLYMFLRSSWFECCGHINPFIVEGKELAADYMQKTVGDIFVAGDRFHYEHNGAVAGRVVGSIISVETSDQEKPVQLASRKNVSEERCETCIAETH